MKKTLLYFGIICSIFSCNKQNNELEEVCITCPDATVTKVYGPDSSITIYNVITPRYYNTCDSFVFYHGAYIEPWRVNENLKLCTKQQKETYHTQGNDTTCVCEITEDTLYNEWQGVNDYFYIQGISKFPYNILYFTQLNDTNKLRIYNNYANSHNVFNGLYLDTIHKPIQMKHAYGRLLYTLKLYKDENYTQLIDIIEGGVTIIRDPQHCPTTGCVGRDSLDKLLTPWQVYY